MLDKETSCIQVRTLGEFSVSQNGCMVRETTRAPKFWLVLQYLITFRHQVVPKEDLIAAIWSTGKSSDPVNALRNMMFRIRAELSTSGMSSAKQMIRRKAGGYQWNNDLPCTVDCEKFEQLCTEADAAGLPPEQQLTNCLAAIALYKGDFLPNAGGEMWAVPLSRHYRVLYFKAVHTALDILYQEQRYSEMDGICKSALKIDQFSEPTYLYYLRSLIKQDLYDLALEEYNRISTLFFDEMGATLSDEMQSLHHEILRHTGEKESELLPMIRQWEADAGFPGAFYCENHIFRILYQVEARSMARMGNTAYLLSLGLEDGERRRTHIASDLFDVIQHSLRKGDLFTRMDAQRYLLMLQNLTYEDCKMIARRIQKNLSRSGRSIRLSTRIQPVRPLR